MNYMHIPPPRYIVVRTIDQTLIIKTVIYSFIEFTSYPLARFGNPTKRTALVILDFGLLQGVT